MLRKLRKDRTIYQAASWMHAVPVLLALWLGFWEWACIAGASGERIVVLSVINVMLGVAVYSRAALMGVVPLQTRLVLRYLLFQRSFAWTEVEQFDLHPLRGGLALRLRTSHGREVLVPACQFASAEARESWLRTHRLIWSGGESDDVLGVLNALVASHNVETSNQPI
jgi:hypothetical protein